MGPGLVVSDDAHWGAFPVNQADVTLRADRVGTRWGALWVVSNAKVCRQGTPVVFVHGLVIAGRYMLPAARLLAPLAPVFVIDLLGYGKSAKPRHLLRVSELADVLAEFLDVRGFGSAHWIGNSFGCQIIVDLAARHPRRTGRLVLQGPTVDEEARSGWAQFRRLVANSRHEPASLTAITIGDYWRAGLCRALGTARMALADRIEDKMPGVVAPTLIVRGERDPLVPERWARKLTRLAPRAQLRVIKGEGHALNYAAPAAFVAVVRPFFNL